MQKKCTISSDIENSAAAIKENICIYSKESQFFPFSGFDFFVNIEYKAFLEEYDLLPNMVQVKFDLIRRTTKFVNSAGTIKTYNPGFCHNYHGSTD